MRLCQSKLKREHPLPLPRFHNDAAGHCGACMKAVARGSGSGSAATQYLRVGNHQTLEEVDKGVFVVEVDGSKTITLAISHSSGNFENQCTVKLGFSRLHSPHPRPPSTLPHCLTLCHHLMLCCVLRVAPSIRTQGQMSCADAASSSAREKCDRCGTSRDAGLAHMASVVFRSESRTQLQLFLIQPAFGARA